MKNSNKFLPIFLTTLLVTLFSCQEEDSALSSLEGTVSFGGISLEFTPMGTAGSRLAGVSPWVHIFPNSAEIVFTNKVTEEEFVLEYNPNDFTTPYSISLPFGAYEFISKVEAGIFSDFLPFEATGEFVLDSQNLEISLNGKSDYGLITVKNQYLDDASVTNGNTVSQLVLPDGGTHRYKYLKGGTATTLKITESTQGSTISKEINVLKNTHYNFVLKFGEGTATITDLTIDPFELVDEEIIIGGNAKFFDENGTIKCPQASPGDKGSVNGKTYEAVDRALLIQRRDEGAELSCVCTSLVKDMSLLFGQYSIYNSEFNQDISSWDVSNVTNMEYMFYGAEKFNQPIGNWDVSSVTNMEYMLGSGGIFNQPIGNWDVSSVLNMTGLFANLREFDQPIGDWDVSNVSTMSTMFEGSSRFNQPLNSWDVSKVENMNFMFSVAVSFNQELCDWDVSSVSKMDYMFESALRFDQPIGNWNVSKVTGMNYLFSNARNFNQPIGNWDVGNVTSMEGMFMAASNFNQPIGNWNVERVISMEEMFVNAINFNQPIGNWNVGNVIRLNGMFIGASSFNQPIGNWDVKNVIEMGAMFFNASAFNQPIGNWDVRNVLGMNSMFSNAQSFNQDLSLWCVQYFLSEPSNFSNGSPLTQSNKPVWGTCPD